MTREERINELSKLHTMISKNAAEKIYDLELELQSNKDSVVELFEKNIIIESEFIDKIDRCFQVFLKDICEEFGEDICKDIYDYLPGEEIGFLNQFKPHEIDGVQAIELATTELVNCLEFTPNFKLDQISKEKIKKIKVLSNNIVMRVHRNRAFLVKLNNDLDYEAGVIKEAIRKVGPSKIEIVGPDIIETISADLEKISNEFIKSEAE